MDWFSNEDWKWVLRNASLAAKAARAGKCKGLVFDCEPYGTDPWEYKKQVHTEKKNFDIYYDMVRKRGAQFMTVIQKEFPDPVIHTFYLMEFYNHPNRGAVLQDPNPVKRKKRLAEHQWSLYPAFVVGMFEAAGPKTVITDGNEDSYYYQSPAEFFESYHSIHHNGVNLFPPNLHTKYRTHVQSAQALYVDYIFGLGSHTSTVSLSPEAKLTWFEHNVYYALKTSDRYSWMYSENIDWWQGRWGDIPDGVEQRIIKARKKIAEGKPLGFSR